MSRRKQSRVFQQKLKQRRQQARVQNKTLVLELLQGFVSQGELFAQDEFHGNIQWNAEQLAAQALLWSWQETKNVTDAFEHAREACEQLGWTKTAKSYTSLMNALHRYDQVFAPRLRERFQTWAEQAGGRFFRTGR